MDRSTFTKEAAVRVRGEGEVVGFADVDESGIQDATTD